MLEQRLDAILGPAISHEDDGNDTEERFSDTVSTALSCMAGSQLVVLNDGQSRLPVSVVQAVTAKGEGRRPA